MLAGQSSTVALRYIYNLEFLHSVNLYYVWGTIYPIRIVTPEIIYKRKTDCIDSLPKNVICLYLPSFISLQIRMTLIGSEDN